ncbi:MAG: DNA polymerase III subunit delta [Oscillospiraceae bacterium]|nr:DNA polymerase III subunit delta [Oscillospiraceae bacterium]
MAEKRNKEYEKLKSDLAAGTPGGIYIFYGEETYLREHYLRELQKAVVPPAVEAFNLHRFSGKTSIYEIAEAVEAMPMMSERTLVLVTDLDLYKMNEDQRGRFIELVEDHPPYCCLVFVYDLIDYKPNKTYKKLYAAIEKNVREVRFDIQERSALMGWIARRFRAVGKEIDARTAEHLIFTCGALMTGLVPEIEKIGAYARGKSVTVQDIDAVAEPILDAVVFDMTNAITRGDYDRASELLGQLFKKQEEPIKLLAVIGKELRRIYTARIALDEGRDRLWLMELWKMRSDYPARLAMDAARKVTREWCCESVRLCGEIDVRMKSEKGFDSEGELKLFLMRLAQGVRK